MAGGSGRVVTGGGIAGGKARVENERLWVDAVISSGGGGGGGGDVNITAVGGNPVTTTVPVSGTVSVTEPVSIDDNGGSITVDGTVAISSIPEPVEVEQSLHDNLNANANIQVGNVDVSGANPVPVTGTITVGGTVTVAEPVSVDDNGGSLTVDGTVTVSSITAPVTIAEPVSVDDNGSSLTVDGTVAVSSVGGTVAVAGTVAVSSVIPGTGATNLGKAEDALHATGDVGVMALAVRQDALAALAANGDYIPLTTDSQGRLRVAEGFTVHPLSSSTNGRPIVVNTTGFVAIHTVPALSVDTITIYATNVGTTDRTIILGWGSTATGDQIFAFVPAGETVVVASGYVSNATVAIQAALNVAGTVRVVGEVIRRPA